MVPTVLRNTRSRMRSLAVQTALRRTHGSQKTVPPTVHATNGRCQHVCVASGNAKYHSPGSVVAKARQAEALAQSVARPHRPRVVQSHAPGSHRRGAVVCRPRRVRLWRLHWAKLEGSSPVSVRALMGEYGLGVRQLPRRAAAPPNARARTLRVRLACDHV